MFLIGYRANRAQPQQTSTIFPTAHHHPIAPPSTPTSECPRPTLPPQPLTVASDVMDPLPHQLHQQQLERHKNVPHHL
jgi:hypothetical protein